MPEGGDVEDVNAWNMSIIIYLPSLIYIHITSDKFLY
jgi:hypothetical protein